MSCETCGKKIETTKGCAYEVTGWVIPRGQGGVGHLMRRGTTGKFLCQTCTTNLRYGVSEGQLTIT